MEAPLSSIKELEACKCGGILDATSVKVAILNTCIGRDRKSSPKEASNRDGQHQMKPVAKLTLLPGYAHSDTCEPEELLERRDLVKQFAF